MSGKLLVYVWAVSSGALVGKYYFGVWWMNIICSLVMGVVASWVIRDLQKPRQG